MRIMLDCAPAAKPLRPNEMSAARPPRKSHVTTCSHTVAHNPSGCFHVATCLRTTANIPRGYCLYFFSIRGPDRMSFHSPIPASHPRTRFHPRDATSRAGQASVQESLGIVRGQMVFLALVMQLGGGKHAQGGGGGVWRGGEKGRGGGNDLAAPCGCGNGGTGAGGGQGHHSGDCARGAPRCEHRHL